MTQALSVAFTHAEIALASASKAVLNQCFLGFSDTLGKFGQINLKNCGIVELTPPSVIWGFENRSTHDSLLNGMSAGRTALVGTLPAGVVRYARIPTV